MDGLIGVTWVRFRWSCNFSAGLEVGYFWPLSLAATGPHLQILPEVTLCKGTGASAHSGVYWRARGPGGRGLTLNWLTMCLLLPSLSEDSFFPFEQCTLEPSKDVFTESTRWPFCSCTLSHVASESLDDLPLLTGNDDGERGARGPGKEGKKHQLT